MSFPLEISTKLSELAKPTQKSGELNILIKFKGFRIKKIEKIKFSDKKWKLASFSW